ncbi:MAG: CopG family ribbon-helix-helix protein [Chromatocurvus sp.]
MPNSTVGVRLSDEIQQRLERLGRARDRTPHYLMKAAIEQFLIREEALETERQLVRERWARYELTGEIVAHADVRAWAESLAQPGDYQPE